MFVNLRFGSHNASSQTHIAVALRQPSSQGFASRMLGNEACSSLMSAEDCAASLLSREDEVGVWSNVEMIRGVNQQLLQTMN